MVQLLRTAFLHKPIHRVIKQIHKETTSYWDFCYVFDSSFYELVPPNMKGKPCRRPPVHHFLRNGLPRCYRDLPTTPTPIAATALHSITNIPDANHQRIVSTLDLETTPDTAPETLKDPIDENKAQKLEITSSPARPDKYRFNINRTAPFPPNRPLSKTAMAAELAITNSTTGLLGLGTMALTTSHRHSPPCVVFKKTDPGVSFLTLVTSITDTLESITWDRRILSFLTSNYSALTINCALTLPLSNGLLFFFFFLTPVGHYSFQNLSIEIT
ncbi:hypothetical protein PP707_04880 [Acetobacter pasteurianus]|nr:hypothetical protein [Acetobacter pasteurianus]